MTLHDPLTYPQLFAYQDALREVQELVKKEKKVSIQQLNFILLKGIIPCVKKWELENLPKNPTPENFPATPTIKAGELMDWLREEVMLLITGTVTVPNE